jgi:hypothetical protein
MDYRKALLSAASVLVLTAAAPDSAQAAISPTELSTPGGIAAERKADPFMALLARTGGTVAGDAVEAGIVALFRDATPAQVEGFPQIMAGLVAMGASVDAIERTRGLLVELVSSSSSVGDELRESVIVQLETGAKPIMLAQRGKKKRDPDEVGQIGGSGG